SLRNQHSCWLQSFVPSLALLRFAAQVAGGRKPSPRNQHSCWLQSLNLHRPDSRCSSVETAHARPRDWQEVCARVGLVAKGVSYALVGVLAVGVAVGVGGSTTSRDGALHELAGNGFGKVVLVLQRIGYLGRAAIYFGLAYSAARIVAGAGRSESQTEKAHKTTATVLSWPAGRWLVGAAAVVAIGVGLWNLYRGLSRKFEDKWVDRSDPAQTW